MLNILAALLFVVDNASYQQPKDSLSTAINKLQKYNSLNSVEKVHLHTDRPYYTIGDTIWFKAYTVSGEKNLATNLSRYLYVELLEGDTVKQSLRLRLKNGMAAGDLILSEDWLPGNYRLRAYTNWMRNFNPEHFFEKSFLIYQETTAEALTREKILPTLAGKGKKISGTEIPDVQFFPEGGSMIDGVLCKVGFKILGADGLSREASGYLTDDAGNNLIDIGSEYAGMGNFSFIPSAGAKYKAVLTFKDGRKQSFGLPAVKSEGYSLAVNNSRPDRIIAHVAAAKNQNKDPSELTFLASYNGNVVYNTPFKLDSTGSFTIALPKKQLSSGVMELSLIDSRSRIRAERLVFIAPPAGQNPLISGTKENYGLREKVSLSLASNDSSVAKQAVLSVAVVDETAVPFAEEKEVSILSSLLLKTDIKGHIESPNYYFNNTSLQKNRHLDNLLLTQGWRRYNWEEVMSETYTKASYWPEMGPAITGKVTNTWKKPVAGATIVALPAKSLGAVKQVLTDSLGRFNISLAGFSDTSSFVVQAKNPKGGNSSFLELDKTGAAGIQKPASPLASLDDFNNQVASLLEKNAPENSARLSAFNKGIMLNVVTLQQKKKATAYIPPNSWNLNGAGGADRVVSGDRLKVGGTLENALYSFVRGYQGNFRQYSRGQEGLLRVIIDGSPVDADLIEAIVGSYTLDDIESIEIINGGGSYAFVYGNSSQGILLINTKRGKFEIQRKFTPGLTYFIPKAIYNHREFYSPVYKVAQPVNQPDLRKTIYWNPEVRTDEKGKATIGFYTADFKGTYKVILEGINAEGIPVRTITRLKIE
ncbi:hypothetical protein ACFSJU_10000 [Paradesertivirga mongoliensis]|uniref:TonB-dependent receptor plug domain-containing protein n=1 Tax=Paradesertivirga mongoliensis TaxID=2100740 RepID=A0ABW4ZKV5_9SPHI|nr:hypothetical protein [Pedobacter mongoliensis]